MNYIIYKNTVSLAELIFARPFIISAVFADFGLHFSVGLELGIVGLVEISWRTEEQEEREREGAGQVVVEELR